MHMYHSTFIIIPHSGNPSYYLFIPVTKMPKESKPQKLPQPTIQEASSPTTKEMTLPTAKEIQDDTRCLVIHWYWKIVFITIVCHKICVSWLGKLTMWAHWYILKKYHLKIFNAIRLCQRYNKWIATSKQSYKYLLVGFAGFQNLFQMWHKISQVNIMGQVGGGLCPPFRHNGTSCMPKKWPLSPQITLQWEASIW